MATSAAAATLGEVASLRKGVSYKGEFLDRPGLRLLGLGTLVPGGGLQLDKARTYGGPVKAHQRIRPGELLLALTDITQDGRVLGSPAMVPQESVGEFAVTHHVARIEIRDPAEVDARYLFYALQSRPARDYMKGVATGTTVRAVSIDDAELMPISIPGFAEQRRIANILGTLDDKIELNRRMNETLEEMARALFKSWFVNFDSVRAKAEGRDSGLPAHLADLFPDRLVGSALGELPEGWSAGVIGDLADLNPESWTSGSLPDTVNYVDLTNTKWGRISGVSIHGRDDAPSRARRKLRAGDTVIGTVRPGNGAYALINRDDLTGSTAFAVLRPRNRRDAAWCYLAASRDAVVRGLEFLAGNWSGSLIVWHSWD